MDEHGSASVAGLEDGFPDVDIHRVEDDLKQSFLLSRIRTQSRPARSRRDIIHRQRSHASQLARRGGKSLGALTPHLKHGHDGELSEGGLAEDHAEADQNHRRCEVAQDHCLNRTTKSILSTAATQNFDASWGGVMGACQKWRQYQRCLSREGRLRFADQFKAVLRKLPPCEGSNHELNSALHESGELAALRVIYRIPRLPGK